VKITATDGTRKLVVQLLTDRGKVDLIYAQNPGRAKFVQRGTTRTFWLAREEALGAFGVMAFGGPSGLERYLDNHARIFALSTKLNGST